MFQVSVLDLCVLETFCFIYLDVDTYIARVTLRHFLLSNEGLMPSFLILLSNIDFIIV